MIGVTTTGRPEPYAGRSATTAATVNGLCQSCVADLDASAGVVSLMTRAGYRAAAHATDTLARRLDEDQFTLGEGPSLEAFDSSAAVLALDLRDEPWPERWPLFVPAAQRWSIRAALSFPLLAGASSLGVMTVYGSDPVRMDAQRLTRAKSTADEVTRTLLAAAPGAARSSTAEPSPAARIQRVPTGRPGVTRRPTAMSSSTTAPRSTRLRA